MNTEKELIKKRGGVKAKLTQFSTYLNIAKSSDKLIGARGASGRRRGAIQRAEPARGPVLRAGVAGAHPAGGPARPCAQPVKAVHIELVTELTKEAFMAALSRFIARRGRPQNIHSDQGTSFVGASNELQRFLRDTSDDISGQLADDGIKFNFIPPYTPHFGGLWEAAVKSVKFHLRRVLGLAHLTYEEMSTCLSQIEAILNSRPLTPLPSDPSNDFTALTPAHFLIGRSLMSVPHPQVTDVNIKLLPRYQRVEQIRQHFWNRFSNEYLSLLQQKTKWHRSSPEQLMEGTLVLVKDRTMPPLLWPLGRIIKVHPGTDGITRVVDVLTKKGTIQRAYNNICPLPTS
ncbi:uncharacterized protein LOC125490971 [Plutella xylostella]|uniref:uncharacterized protein LOC125490971 n=1 Tax=Plutella xylostella TaxID=51655 RepID=UPI00203248A9|nr:uncharacterized protein LOC125490971 [Plutella xylostella]